MSSVFEPLFQVARLFNHVRAKMLINQVSYDHRSYERNLSNCSKCVHNCDDHSSLDFKICSSIYETISLHMLINIVITLTGNWQV